MRKALRWLLALTVLIGTVSTAGAATAAEPGATATKATTDIKDRLLAIPGMSLIEEKPYTGYRFFVLNYTQPVDHRHPSKGTFQQRITVLHKDAARPTVFYTGGYNVSTTPSRREPTQIVDGNQVSMEYRFFTPSRPAPADWTKLDIWQAASDQHRIFQALKKIYTKNWISTGGSKGGMTATYYERFYPRDMDGVVAYVAPNDVVNNEDSAYDRFFTRVGTKECRDRLNAVQREALVRREPLEKKYAAYAADERLHLHHHRQPGPRLRGRRPRLRLGLLAVQPAVRLRHDPGRREDRDRRRDLDVRRHDLRLLLLHGPGPGAVHAVLLPGGHPARRPHHPLPVHREEVPPLRLPAAAELRTPRHPDEVPAVRDAGRRLLGAGPRTPHALRLRRRTTRGARSASASARARRTRTSSPPRG